MIRNNMDADSSYGGSDTAQDLHSNHDNNSFNDTTTHTHDSPSTTITATTPTESNSYYHKNEITLPVNYDENDYQKQQEQQPHYLTTANLNINETTENPTSNLEEMSKNFKSTSRLNVMDDNPSANGGLDNPAFVKADDDDDECNNKVEIKSTFDHNRPYNGDLNTTAALGLSSPTNNNKNNDEQQLAEAVNLELINLKPTNGKDVTGMYENGMSTIPIKRENDNEIGNPYDEYFVPVNEHRKYMSKTRKGRNSVTFAEMIATGGVDNATGLSLTSPEQGVMEYPQWLTTLEHKRGEKLYVTMDKRSKKTRNKCLCWGVCLCIVAAAVIIGILAAVGVIGNQGAHPVQEVSARQFSGNAPETPVKIKKGGVFGLPPDIHDEEAVTTLRPTPGPPVSTVSSLLPMTETSMIQVPRALESQLIIDNLQFMPELNDSNSAEFKQLAQSLETELKNSLFDNNVLKHGAADIEVKILDFAPGSVVVHYRIVWTFKDGIHNPPDPINPDMAKRKLRSLLAKNNGMIGDYSVSEKSITTGPVLDSCRIDNYGCEFNCSFDYQLADFICICPQHKILANDKKTCIDYDENHLPDFPFDHNEHLQPEPEATEPSEDLYGVHHDYHETIVQPTSEPAPEPQPEPELTSKHPEAEPEPTNPPEEINDTQHNYHETLVQPTSEPTSEPSPEPQLEDVVVQPEPEPTSKPEPQPEPTAKTEIEPEINTQINIVSHENYIHIHEVTSSPEPITEPNTEPNIEPVAEPTSEPAPEPSAEPTSKSTPESDATEDSTMPMPVKASKSVDYNVIPLINTVTEPAAEPTAEPTVEPVAEPTSEPAPEPAIPAVPEPTSEPSAEPAAEPTTEPSIEQVTDRSEEATVTPEPVAVTESVDKSTGKSIEINVPIVNVPTEPAAETTAEPTAEPAAEPTVEPTAEPAAEPTAEPTIAPHLSENLTSSTEPNAITTTEPAKESMDEHNSINSVSVEVPVEATAEPIAEATTEPIAQSTDPPSSETNELVKESGVESVNETTTKASVELVSESVTEHMDIDNETNTIKAAEMISNIVTTMETLQNSSMEEITELPKELESSRSLAVDLSEHNDSKTESPLETTMEPMTESTPKQEDSENHIPEIVAETTISQFESNSGTTQNAIEAETAEVTTINDKVSAETTTESEPLLNIQTESPLLSVIPLEEAKTNPEQSPRQSKLNDVNPDEVETTTLIDNISNISEKNLEEIKTEEPFHQINSIVVSVNESKAEAQATTELTISVNNATETIKIQEPKIYEITKPPSEAERDFNEIHSTVIDHQPSNMSHLNIIQESTENNSAFDNMSPFLPEIDNDTFVNKLHLGEHYFEQHTEETPPPRLDNDEKNETNPLDVTHKINETDNVISTENPEKLKEKLEKSTLPPEIINNVHSNPFFENLKEIKLLEEVKNSSGVDSSTEDLLALETTTYRQNTTENSVESNQSTVIHAEIIQTATESINVIPENTEESSENSYAVEESYNDITTTERLFVPKVQTTTEVTLVTNPDVDLSVIPLEDTENDISAEEHSVLDKFTRQTDEITTTPETVIETSQKCLNDQFLCINGTSKDGSYCIPIQNRCDSMPDCSDGSDELDCKGNCHENFQCSNGQCLKRYLVCDGIQHCSDGTDESNCAQWNCTAAEFSCGDHQHCLPSEWRCDGRKHCADGRDEHNCNQTCPETSYYCKDEGICIPMSWRCDGKSDCSNSEDEQSCGCNDNQFRCSLGGGCIDSKQRCDGVEDCADRSDEWNCIRLHNRIVQIATGNNTWTSVCSENWNETYSNIVCNYLGYSGAAITDNFSSNDTNYLQLKPEQNVSILKQFDNLEECANIVTVTCQEFSCGGNHQTVEEQQARIIGGSPSTETQWPSLSLLYNKKSNIQCTATILTPIWAIASYSCVNGSDWILYAGNTNFFNNPDNATTQMVEVERIIQHPQVKFAQFEYTNDVVLIKLRKPLILTRNVSAVCLPENNIETRQLCVVAGWGVSQPGETNNQYLHYLPVPVIDNIECNSTKHYNGSITTDKICAGFTDSTKTPCYNDEGAPLMCFSDSASIWELQGTLSYHDNCGTNNHPAIYTSINPNIKEWIVNTIGQNPLKRA